MRHGGDAPLTHPLLLSLMSLGYIILKIMALVASFSHFVFAFVLVIVIMGASVDGTCHDLSEYVWLYGSVKHT